jgi:hypothetical protein
VPRPCKRPRRLQRDRAAAALVGYVLWRWRTRRRAVRRDFNNVFAFTSKGGKEALIKRWMDRKKCSRLEAMRLAVEEWRHDNR